MAVEDKELALNISHRLDELMIITGISIKGLALISNVKYSYLRAVCYGNVAISAEWIRKIGNPFGINLVDFFSFEKPLSLEIKNRPAVTSFYKKYEGKGLGYFRSEEEAPQKPAEQTRKYERDTIAHIVLKTNYFDTAHLVGQMITDFAKDHKLILESGRLYELLAKYVGKELEKRETTKKTKGGKVSKKKVYAYVRKK